MAPEESEQNERENEWKGKVRIKMESKDEKVRMYK